MNITFTKMQGLGNDFVLMESSHVPESWANDLSGLSARLSDRHFGVGSDGLILVAPPTSDRFDIRFIFFNSDGSPAEMCGNGIRCFALYVKDRGLVDKNEVVVETAAGPLRTIINTDRTVTVDMGRPVLKPEAIPFKAPAGVSDQMPLQHIEFQVDEAAVKLTPVSMGNPHAIIFQNDLPMTLDPVVYGPKLEVHPSFPAKTNVEFVEVIDRETLKLTVWERGCGFTLACGTGACATAVAAILASKTDTKVEIRLPGGPLKIEWAGSLEKRDFPVYMTGPAQYVFEGTMSLTPAATETTTDKSAVKEPA
jgi:diaminopimelate epimerase